MVIVSTSMTSAPLLAHASVAEQVGAVVSVVLVAWFYLTGVGRLWARGGRGRVIAPWRVMLFGVGLAAIVSALTGPVPSGAERWFSIHMVQHQLLIMVAAPLLVVGRPGMAFVSAATPRLRRDLVRWRRFAKPRLASPWVAVAAMVVILWTWHVPQFYDTAAVNPMLHAAQHATLFWSSVALWTAVGTQRTDHLGRSIVALFVAGIATSMLGVVLLFAGTPLYPHYAEMAARLGGSAIDDQRYAALVMWIPSGVVGLGATWVLFNRWLIGLEQPRRPLSLVERVP